MPAKKRTKSSKKPAKKGKHALSPTEKELLDCCENRQPVLLYGKDDYDREKLVRKIHSRNGGIRRSWEYQGNDKNIKSADDLENEIVKAENDGNRKRIRELLLDCNDTIRTYTDCDDTFRIYITGDSNLLSGQEVFKGLSSFRHKHSGVNGKVINLYLYEKNLSWTDHKQLLQYKGTLFIDNLRCQKKDRKWYEDLAVKIESLKREVPDSQRGWLVFYAEDCSNFPPYFTNQLEPVSLDSKDAVIKEKQPAKKVLRETYLYRGEHPDHTFYAVVPGKKKPKKIQLSENTQEHTALNTLCNKEKQKASIEELLHACKIKGYKKGSYAVRDKKPALHKVISSLNKILRDIFKIKYCVQFDEETKNHYSLIITCRDK